MPQITFTPRNNRIEQILQNIPTDSTLVFGIANKGISNTPIQFKSLSQLQGYFGDEIVLENGEFDEKSLVRTGRYLSNLVADSDNLEKIYFVRISDDGMSYINLSSPVSTTEIITDSENFFGIVPGTTLTYHTRATGTDTLVSGDVVLSNGNNRSQQQGVTLRYANNDQNFITFKLNEVDRDLISESKFISRINPNNSSVIDKIVTLDFGYGEGGTISNRLASYSFVVTDFQSLKQLEDELIRIKQIPNSKLGEFVSTIDVKDTKNSVTLNTHHLNNPNLYRHYMLPSVTPSGDNQSALNLRDVRNIDSVTVNTTFDFEHASTYADSNRNRYTHPYPGIFEKNIETFNVNQYIQRNYSLQSIKYKTSSSSGAATEFPGISHTLPTIPTADASTGWLIYFDNFIGGNDQTSQFRKGILRNFSRTNSVIRELSGQTPFSDRTIMIDSYDDINDELVIYVDGRDGLTLQSNQLYNLRLMGDAVAYTRVDDLETLRATSNTYYISPQNNINIHPTTENGYEGYVFNITGTEQIILNSNNYSIDRYSVGPGQDFAGTKYLQVTIPDYVDTDSIADVVIRFTEYPNSFLALLSNKVSYGAVISSSNQVTGGNATYEIAWNIVNPIEGNSNPSKYKNNIFNSLKSVFEHPCLNMYVSGISIGDTEIVNNEEILIDWYNTLGFHISEKNRVVNNCVLFINVLNQNQYYNRDKHNVININNYNADNNFDDYLSDVIGNSIYSTDHVNASETSLKTAIDKFNSFNPGMFFVPSSGLLTYKATETSVGYKIPSSVVLLSSVINNIGAINSVDGRGRIPAVLDNVLVPNTIYADKLTNITQGKDTRFGIAQDSRVNYIVNSLSTDNLNRSKIFNNFTLAPLAGVFRGFMDVYASLVMNNNIRPLILKLIRDNNNLDGLTNSHILENPNIDRLRNALRINGIDVRHTVVSNDNATSHIDVVIRYFRGKDVTSIDVGYTVIKTDEIT